MSDLVKTLRGRANQFRYTHPVDAEIDDKAADALEAKDAEIEQQAASIRHHEQMNAKLCADIEQQQAKIERLRKCERHEYDRANAADAKIEKLRDDLMVECTKKVLRQETIADLLSENAKLQAAMKDWRQRIKESGKRKCPVCYSIHCDIGIALNTGEQGAV